MMRLALLCLTLVSVGSSGAAQDAEQIPVSVEIHVTRHDGDSISESQTHRIQLTANRSGQASVRFGQEVPIAEQYRNVGTNIQCRVETRGERFQLWLDLERSEPTSTVGPPTFRSFSTHQQVLIDEGRRQELVHVSHPDSDESWTVEVALTRAP